MTFLKEFETLEACALHFAAVELAMRRQVRKGLEKSLALIEKDAKKQIGHYQTNSYGRRR